MFNRAQVKKPLNKHRAICECAQCSTDYECNIYDAAKSKVGHLCSCCKNQITSLVDPDPSDLRRVFAYDPQSGELTYRNDSISGLAGTAVGYSHSQGYLSTRIGGKDYLVHRVIWAMQQGVWPTQVDHINHVRSDNRWSNLRDVSARENQMNMQARKNNTTGVQGVRVLPSGKFHAYIMVNRKQIALGSYDNISDATEARKHAEVLYGFHTNHGS